jgi:hypothetical protein
MAMRAYGSCPCERHQAKWSKDFAELIVRDLQRDQVVAEAAITEIDGALIRATDGLVELPARPRLYHYTSSEGFRGIVESNSLRYSDPLFLNDGSEVHYANDILLEAASTLTDLSEREAQFAHLLIERIKTTAVQYRPIIFCLCEESDLLNQWRDYGRDEVPYCIEFNTEGLLTADWSFPCSIVKIIYDRAEQLTIVSKILRDIADIFRRHRSALFNPELSEMVINAAVSEIWGALITFKNPAFAAEQEWRLHAYAVHLGRQRPKFRSGSLGVSPFFERSPRMGHLLPISRVWIGPSPFAQVSKHSTAIFLDACGYNVEVIASEIPSR